MASVNINIKLTPEQLAEEFAGMTSANQAAFFNHISKIASPWINMQLQHITEEDNLTLAGRRVMHSIGEYSHWGIVCDLTKQLRNENGISQ
jgi:hypothetical protein